MQRQTRSQYAAARARKEEAQKALKSSAPKSSSQGRSVRRRIDKAGTAVATKNSPATRVSTRRRPSLLSISGGQGKSGQAKSRQAASSRLTPEERYTERKLAMNLAARKAAARINGYRSQVVIRPEEATPFRSELAAGGRYSVMVFEGTDLLKLTQNHGDAMYALCASAEFDFRKVGDKKYPMANKKTLQKSYSMSQGISARYFGQLAGIYENHEPTLFTRIDKRTGKVSKILTPTQDEQEGIKDIRNRFLMVVAKQVGPETPGGQPKIKVFGFANCKLYSQKKGSTIDKVVYIDLVCASGRPDQTLKGAGFVLFQQLDNYARNYIGANLITLSSVAKRHTYTAYAEKYGFLRTPDPCASPERLAQLNAMYKSRYNAEIDRLLVGVRRDDLNEVRNAYQKRYLPGLNNGNLVYMAKCLPGEKTNSVGVRWKRYKAERESELAASFPRPQSRLLAVYDTVNGRLQAAQPLPTDLQPYEMFSEQRPWLAGDNLMWYLKATGKNRYNTMVTRKTSPRSVLNARRAMWSGASGASGKSGKSGTPRTPVTP